MIIWNDVSFIDVLLEEHGRNTLFTGTKIWASTFIAMHRLSNHGIKLQHISRSIVLWFTKQLKVRCLRQSFLNLILWLKLFFMYLLNKYSISVSKFNLNCGEGGYWQFKKKLCDKIIKNISGILNLKWGRGNKWNLSLILWWLASALLFYVIAG